MGGEEGGCLRGALLYGLPRNHRAAGGGGPSAPLLRLQRLAPFPQPLPLICRQTSRASRRPSRRRWVWGGGRGQPARRCAPRPPFLMLLLLPAAAMSALSAKVDARDGAAAAAAAGHAAPRQLPCPMFTLADFGDSLLLLMSLVRQARRRPRADCMRAARRRLGCSEQVASGPALGRPSTAAACPWRSR